MEEVVNSWNPNHGVSWLRDWWEKMKCEAEMNEIQRGHYNKLIFPHVILSVWQIGPVYCYEVHPLASHVTIVYRLYPNGKVDEIVSEHFIKPLRPTASYKQIKSY